MSRTHPNLVGHWRMENNLLDTSGNGWNGTRKGNGVYVKGKYGDGHQVGPTATDEIEIAGSNSGLAFVHQTMVWTVAFWAYVDTLSDQVVRGIWRTNNAATSNTGVTIALDTRRLAAPNFAITNNTFRIIANNGIAEIQNAVLQGWHHYALTANGTSGGYVFYRDGVQIGTSGIGGTQTGNSWSNVLTARGFTGLGNNDKQDDLQIWNRALAPHQIAAIYNGVDPAFLGDIA